MNKAIVNIGLNVGGSEPSHQQNRTLLSLNILPQLCGGDLSGGDATHMVDFTITNNNGSDWGDERTVVAELSTHWDLSEFCTVMQRLCQVLKQDSIAVKFNGHGVLVFNPSYTGERYEFNNDYFVNL